jgi:pimeloyl-ACP methyl ester carboxylesterase
MEVERMTGKPDVKTIDAGVLTVSYLEDGPPDGGPVVLSHGFPFDVHAVLTVRRWLPAGDGN